MILGVHEATRLVYEGDSLSCGYPVNPLPLISQVGLGNTFEEAFAALKSTSFHEFSLIFREDSYDPVSRTRRGRIYKAPGQKPEQWVVIPHPAHPVRSMELTAEKQLQGQRMFSFYNQRVRSLVKDSVDLRKLHLLLGFQDGYTKWAIVSTEIAFNGQEIVTLKAINTMDVVPDINFQKILPDEQARVKDSVEKLLEVSYKSNVESIVDRACEACLSVLLAVIRGRSPEVRGLTLDLAIKRMASDPNFSDRKMMLTAADLLRLLHSRGKVSFQDKYNTRSLNYHDAQTALDCLSTVVFELDLAL
ncbi:MAG: hypothetical protein AB7I27_00220 [Bacteriovoracaceae bacterium]